MSDDQAPQPDDDGLPRPSDSGRPSIVMWIAAVALVMFVLFLFAVGLKLV